MKRCPYCRDNKVILFDSDNDYCEKCERWFPAVAKEEDKCETGCKHFTGGEIAHHKDCYFYPESRTQMYDDLKADHEKLKIGIKKVIVEIQAEVLKNIRRPNLGKKGCLDRLQKILRDSK